MMTYQIHSPWERAIGNLGSPFFASRAAAASTAEKGNEQGSERAQRVPIKLADQPQALSEQETEATLSAGHPFGSHQEFVMRLSRREQDGIEAEASRQGR